MEQSLQRLITQGHDIMHLSQTVTNIIHLSDSNDMPTDVTNDIFNVFLGNIAELQQNVREIQSRHARDLRARHRLQNAQITRRYIHPYNRNMDDEVGVLHHPFNADAVPRISVPRMKTPIKKVVEKTEFDAMMDECCGICLEIKTRGETILTSCGHNYCKTCFDHFVLSRKQKRSRKDKVVHCPHCRTPNPQVTVFMFTLRRIRVREYFTLPNVLIVPLPNV
jgi:hypothetical protein